MELPNNAGVEGGGRRGGVVELPNNAPPSFMLNILPKVLFMRQKLH